MIVDAAVARQLLAGGLDLRGSDEAGDGLDDGVDADGAQEEGLQTGGNDFGAAEALCERRGGGAQGERGGDERDDEAGGVRGYVAGVDDEGQAAGPPSAEDFGAEDSERDGEGYAEAPPVRAGGCVMNRHG